MLGLQNPFGAAKPREAVLADRSGKTESEILQEEVAKEKLKVLPTLDGCIAYMSARHAEHGMRQGSQCLPCPRPCSCG